MYQRNPFREDNILKWFRPHELELSSLDAIMRIFYACLLIRSNIWQCNVRSNYYCRRPIYADRRYAPRVQTQTPLTYLLIIVPIYCVIVMETVYYEVADFKLNTMYCQYTHQVRSYTTRAGRTMDDNRYYYNIIVIIFLRKL